MHRVAVIAMHGLVPFDLATPCAVFEGVRAPGVRTPYEVSVCGEAAVVRSGLFDIRVQWGLERVAHADTVIVPGIASVDADIGNEVVAVLRDAAARGARVASICTGAFVLAAAGLLDGRRATTHWAAAAELAQRHPEIDVDANVLFVDGGQVLTSAGAAAGVDLCLHMVRSDHGAAVAANSARHAVMPLHREGGQAQFIVDEPGAGAAPMQPLLVWLQEQLHRSLTLEDIARKAHTSTRTLCRRFRAHTGVTPLQWLLAARVRRAQVLLETTPLSIEAVAMRSGFASAANLRDRFLRLTGTTPTRYRRAFGCPQPA